MDKKILTLLLMVVVAMGASAATKYEINVAGVEVTSDNASHITGGDIISGYGVYNASTKTLTLYSINIRRNGQDNYGIHNRKCDNLTIVFSGNCGVVTADNALKLERSTTLTSAAGSSSIFYSAARICANLKSYTYYIKGTGKFDFQCNQSGQEAIKGDGSGSTNVYFQGGTVTASSTNRSALSSFSAYFYNGNHLEVSSNGSNASFSDVAMQFYGNEAVISPYQAFYSSTAKSVCIGTTPVTNKKIIISDDYVAILNSTYFPDQNFRTKLYNSYFNKGYINSSDVANTTALSVSSCGISNLTGLGYFTNLMTFDCSGNNLSSLPSLPNSITSLTCSSNKLTSLPTLPSGLNYLYCNYNQLSSLPTLPSTIKAIYANSNDLGNELTITGKSSLTTLEVKDNIHLYALKCYNNSLTSLSYSGCDLLRTLDCHNNNLASLNAIPVNVTNLDCSNNQLTSLPTLPNTLSDLDCCNNKLTSLPTLPSGLKHLSCDNNKLMSLPTLPNAIVSISAESNKFTSLTINGKSSLRYLYLKNNTLLTTLNARDNAISSVWLTGCTALQSISLQNNDLYMLSVQGLNSLRYLYISRNKIKGDNMTDLVNSLCTIPASEEEGLLGVLSASGNYTEGNTITPDQIAIARSKHWAAKKYTTEWVDIAVPGDVDGDGHVSSADITALYNWLLNNDDSALVNGDQNGDGKITSVDVTIVYNLMLDN